MTEPDKIQWRDEATGMACLIVRNDLGALCGYVGVEPRHKYYGQSYADLPLDVHGGLTFAGPCDAGEHEAQQCVTICHTVEPGESDDVWWLGFDCCHLHDALPKTLPTVRSWGDAQYRDVAFVTQQVEHLAKQLEDDHGLE